jgi:hypothetical protein
MNLNVFIISIPHATIKEHNSPPSTSIPTQLCIIVEEENDTNHETQMPHKKEKNIVYFFMWVHSRLGYLIKNHF